MDREYLEDYKQREKADLAHFLRGLQSGKFSLGKDKYPSDERFVKLQKPVAKASFGNTSIDKIWAQIPFCGSLLLLLPPLPLHLFEKYFFKVSQIPTIIDFIKETGKLQIVLHARIEHYVGLDFLDPFFKELKPPVIEGPPLTYLFDKTEIDKAREIFLTLASVRYFDFVQEKMTKIYPPFFLRKLMEDQETYLFLKLQQPALVEELENFMIDDPRKASFLFLVYGMFIKNPLIDRLREDVENLTLEETRLVKFLPAHYRPKDIRFPCEIGKFLLRKLTYAPYGFDACKELIYHYDAYDLMKVEKSLNEAIVANNPDVVDEKAEELSEILDNIWNDTTLRRRIRGLQIGIPISMAALGSVAAGPIGTLGGFLAGLGYSVADKFIDLGTEGLSERLAKLKTKSYQVNIYDFKKKYKAKITHP